MKTISQLSDQVLIIIMDGFGMNPNDYKNAVLNASKPCIDSVFREYPYTEINASGELVGLPKGVMGNSEVGHLNLGAGRSIKQDLIVINQCIKEGKLGELEKLKTLIKKADQGNQRIHLMGLLSDGGVHSHIEHIKATIKVISQKTKSKIFFHAFMDGRDTAKNSGKKYLTELLEIDSPFTLASMQGRSIAMDRDKRWEKTHRAYKALTGQISPTPLTPSKYLEDQYQQNIFDEFINPALFGEDFSIKDGDVVFFINFRPDRARQLTLAFNDPHFKEFPLIHKPSYYLCMTPYLSEELPNLPVLFEKEKIKGGLSEYLSGLGLKQYKGAETEKYAHVTYFFNGGFDKPFPGEDRTLTPSPRDVKTYDEKPEMSAFTVKDELLKAMDKDYSFYLVNFANPDMVGHTGNYEAAIKAVETVDKCLKEIIPKALKKNMAIILTADHGNSDQMIYPDGSPHTSHTTSLVPVAIIHPALKGLQLKTQKNIKERALKDIAPTVLKILGLPIPDTFTGTPLY